MSSTRIGKCLLQSAPLFWKFRGIGIATDKFSHCCHFYKTYLRLRIEGTITSKHTAIIHFSLCSPYKDICFHHVHHTSKMNHVIARPFYNCRENRSRKISSSTINDTTAAEDVSVTGAEMSQYVVGHDKERKYFYIELQEASSDQREVLAKLEYDWVRPGLVDMYHTEVPPQYQGKGIAKVLATAAFDTFSEQGVQMRPTCTYLQKYLRENQVPRYLEHVEKGFVL